MNERKRLSVDEMLADIAEIAKDPEAGPDRMRAYKMLFSVDSATVTLPEPKSDAEVIDRLARIMKAAGARLTQVAYQRAWPTMKNVTMPAGKMYYTDATDEMRGEAKLMTSLRLLYKHYPEARVRGRPKGYPAYKSTAEKSLWCQDQALKILVERHQRARAAAHETMKVADSVLRTAKDGLDVPDSNETDGLR